MCIRDSYKVGFFQGGATQQFAMVPLNFMTTGKADYLVTGNFSNLAAKEAAKFGEVNIVASSKDKNFTYIPDVNAINYDKDASYIHICQNNTCLLYTSVIFMDPPREGSTPQFIESVARMAPKRVVYVSCNPATLARDLELLTRKGYKVESSTPVDMFPHSEHVEAIVSLQREI